MQELSDLLSDDFINTNQVAQVMQPNKEAKISGNAVRKRIKMGHDHPMEEAKQLAPRMALLKHRIEKFLEKVR